MKLERRLQIAVAILAICGSLILGWEKYDLRLPLLTVVAATVGFVLTDLKGWFQLGSGAAGLVGLTVTALALRDVYRNIDDKQALFLALSNLLVYLQAVLFVRQKAPRVYGMIALLSFLQVAVSAVISLSPLFGGLMVLYMFIAVYALSLFLIYREEYEQARFKWQRNVAPQPPNARWPLLYQPLVLQGRQKRHAASRLRGLWGPTMRTGLITLLVAPLVFVTVPRTSSSRDSWSAGTGLQSTIAFTEDVSLVGDEFTQVLQDPEKVFVARFRDVRTAQNYPILDRDNIYFRGSSRRLIYRNGEWYSDSDRLPQLEHADPISPFEAAQVSPTNDLVAVGIEIEPLPTHGPLRKVSDVLFAIYPFFGLESQTHVYFDPFEERLICPEVFRSERITYQHVTTGFRSGQQLPLRWTTRTELPPDEIRDLLSLPEGFGEDPLRGLKAVAAEVVAALPEEERNDPIAKARALESHLRDSGIYSYSLSRRRSKSDLDPAEDFVVNTKSGHCEYFATVLALMLRSQGIPARVVTGYKGGEWDFETGSCLIRQWHAHAWVEALIPPEYVPPEFQPRPDRAWATSFSRRTRRALGLSGRLRSNRWVENYGVRSAWLRLDATPGRADLTATTWSQVQHIGDMAEVLWSQYVLGMNPQTQRERIYTPFAELFDAHAWNMWWHDVKASLSGADSSYRWISWQAGVVAFGAQLLLLFGYRGLRSWLRRKRTRAPESTSTTSLSEIYFYRRLEQILAEADFHRRRTQTQREFALAVGADLAERPTTAALASVPRRLTELFYRVRFGCHSLSESEHAAIDQQLDALQRALNEPEPMPPAQQPEELAASG